MKNLKLAVISGGATKVAGLLGTVQAVKSRYKPDVIAGVSSGSLTAIAWATNRLDVATARALALTEDDMFSVKPFGLGGIMRALRGKMSLGDMGNLRKMIKEVIPMAVYNNYRLNKWMPAAYAVSVNMDTCKLVAINLKTCGYNRMVDALLASCSIPLASEPVEIDGDLHGDGGLMDHVPSVILKDIMEQEGKSMEEVEEILAIYSRQDGFSGGRMERSLKGVASRTLAIFNWNTTATDEQFLKDLQNHYPLNLFQIFLPSVMQGLYDTDRGRLRELYDKGFDEGFKFTLKYRRNAPVA